MDSVYDLYFKWFLLIHIRTLKTVHTFIMYVQKIRTSLEFRSMGFVVLKKGNILSVEIWQCTAVLIIPFCFSEKKGIDPPGNKPLLLLQFT